MVNIRDTHSMAILNFILLVVAHLKLALGFSFGLVFAVRRRDLERAGAPHRCLRV